MIPPKFRGNLTLFGSLRKSCKQIKKFKSKRFRALTRHKLSLKHVEIHGMKSKCVCVCVCVSLLFIEMRDGVNLCKIQLKELVYVSKISCKPRKCIESFLMGFVTANLDLNNYMISCQIFWKRLNCSEEWRWG